MKKGPTLPEIKKAVGLWVEGHVEEALEQARKGEKAAIRKNDLQARADVYRLMARIFGRLQQSTKAIRYFQRSIYISEDIGDTRGLVESHRGLALALWRIGGNPDPHLDYCRQNIDVLEPEEVVGVYLDIGTIQAEQRSFTNADYFFNLALDTLKKNEKVLKKEGVYWEHFARATNVTGMLNLDRGNPAEAAKHFKRLVEMGKKEGMRWAELYGLINGAHALAEAGKAKEAKTQNERGLKLIKDLEDTNMEGGYWRNDALILLQKKDYNKALESIDRAIEIYESVLDIPSYTGLMLIEKGRILAAKKDDKGAARAYEDAGGKFEEAGNWSEAVRARAMA